MEIKIRAYLVKGKYLWSDEYISAQKTIEAHRVLAGEMMGKDIYEILGEACAPDGFDIVHVDEEGYKEATVLVDVSGLFCRKE